jgi:hypothetical protein
MSAEHVGLAILAEVVATLNIQRIDVELARQAQRADRHFLFLTSDQLTNVGML